MMQSDENAVKVIREQEHASRLRVNFDSIWEQIARRILPHYSNQFTTQNRMAPISQGQQRQEEMVDATGALALTRFAAFNESMLTPRNSTWHHVRPSNPALMKSRNARLWFEELTRLLFQYRYAPKANYSSQKHEGYMMSGAFGTSVIFTDALSNRYEKGLRYRCIHLAQNYFLENHQGVIDTNYRRFPLTARQAVQQFGIDSVPEAIALDAKTPNKEEHEHWFIHKVAPRADADYDPQRKDVMGMPYTECYVSVTGQKTMREGGFFSFPYAISRYMTVPGELYGRSPAMFALPSLRTLNEIKKTMLKQGHRTVDPVLLAHDDGVLDSFSLRPGAINPGGVTADGKPLVHALPIGNLQVGKEQADEERQTINDFFLVSLFQILVENPRMTATEVVERAREKGALLSPTMGREQTESLAPQIEREIDLLTQQRLLPPMPPELLEAKGEYTILYDSPLSRMARAEEVSGLMRTVDYIKDVVAVTQNPEPLDYFDWDTIVPEMADLQAVPVRWLKTMQGVKEMRDGRAQQAQTQQMIQAAPAAGGLLKTVMPPPQAAPAG